MTRFTTPNTIYQGRIESLQLNAFNAGIDASSTLRNGRSNYVLFQGIIAIVTGLTVSAEYNRGRPPASKVKGDLVDAATGDSYEVKSFRDESIATTSEDKFHTAASSLFASNSGSGPVKDALARGDYAAALEICKDKSYSHNDFYIYTNTGGFRAPGIFRFVILATETVLTLLDKTDPRLISRNAIFELCKCDPVEIDLSYTLSASA